MACASTTGWYRWPGAVTTPNGSVVRCMAAPSHDQAKPDWPWRALVGDRRSEVDAVWKPASSARRISRSNRCGGCCSSEA